MRMRTAMLLSFLLAAGTVTGCIPSEPPPGPEDTMAGQAEKTGVMLVGKDEPAKPPETAGKDQAGTAESGLALEDMPRVNAAVQVIPREGGPGFVVRGTLNPKRSEPELVGTIIPAETAEGAKTATWTFSVTYTAPTGGYALGEPFLSRTFGKSVIISLPIELPGKDAVVTQARQPHTASLVFGAPPDASFIVQWFQARDIGKPVPAPGQMGRRAQQ